MLDQKWLPNQDFSQRNGPLSLNLTLEGLVGVGDGGFKLGILVARMCVVVSHTFVQREEGGWNWRRGFGSRALGT